MGVVKGEKGIRGDNFFEFKLVEVLGVEGQFFDGLKDCCWD